MPNKAQSGRARTPLPYCATSVLEHPPDVHPPTSPRAKRRSRAFERSPAESLGRGPPPRSNANPGSHPRCTAPPRPAPRTQVLAAVPAAPIYGGRAPRAQRSRCAAGQPNWHTPRLWPKPPLRCREWPLLPLRCELLWHPHLSVTFVHAAHLSECFDRSRRSPVDTTPVAEMNRAPGGQAWHRQANAEPRRCGAPKRPTPSGSTSSSSRSSAKSTRSTTPPRSSASSAAYTASMPLRPTSSAMWCLSLRTAISFSAREPSAATTSPASS